MKVLVTGGAGYIGSHVVKLLGDRGDEVVVIDNLSTGHKKSLLYGRLYVGDLSDISFVESVFDENKFDGIIHLAGSIVVPESIEDPVRYYQNNTLNSFYLIRMCLKYGVKHFIFSSTAAVYEELRGEVVKESSATNPSSPYGRSKLMVEHFLRDVSESSQEFNCASLRYFNVSGADPDGLIGQAYPGATHLIKVNCEAAVGKRDFVEIYGTDYETPDGTGVRDFIHVTDLADAHLKALDYLVTENKSLTLNCGYSKGFSVREVIEEVKKVSKMDYKVIESFKRDGDLASVVADSTKIKKILNWQPKYDSLELIVKTAYEWENSEVYRKWREDDV